MFARKDSTRLNNFRGFYVNSYYPYKLFGYYSESVKYPSYPLYEFDTKLYRFQTPGIGIGYVLNKNAWFIKTDINYWYGFKHLHDDFSFNADDKNSRNTFSSFPSIEPPAIGSRYYKIKDHIEGSLRMHYFDIGFAITGNITRCFRIYSGWRINFLLNHSYKAEIKREASLYQVMRYTAPYWHTDSVIEVEYLKYNDKEAESKLNQNISGSFFYNLGFNANFRIKKQLFFMDLLFETTSFALVSDGSQAGCATFKLAYVFNYSTNCSRKKPKD